MTPLPKLPVLLLLLLPHCAAPAPRDPADVFGIEGAEGILRARTAEERAAVAAGARFLNRRYGYLPDGSYRDLRDLRDLLDRRELMKKLRTEQVLAFGSTLMSATGYRLEPRRAPELIAAAAGPPGEALDQPTVTELLENLRSEGLLHPKAGRDTVSLDPSRARALRRLAGRADAMERIRFFARPFPYRFRPSDAGAVLRDTPLDPSRLEPIRSLLEALSVDFRPGYLPELRLLAEKEEETRELTQVALEAGVGLAGPSAVIVLARLARDHRPLDAGARARLAKLARLTPWPDSGDFLFLVPLSRVPKIPGLIDELAKRYRYRFRAEDAEDLLLLAERGVPEVAVPGWIERDLAPLRRPRLLFSADPARAFVDANDLVFLDALADVRPDLAGRPRERIEKELRARLRGRPVRYRLGAPYTETADDLSALLRPDLLKALLLTEELADPEIVESLLGLIREDLLDTETELGGYIRLGGNGRLDFHRHRGGTGTGRNDRLSLPPDPEGSALEFHLHATDDDDSAYAGPSSGSPGTDLHRAARHGVDGAVVTALAGSRFDVDFYTSTGKVIDLGVHGGTGKR